MIAAIYIYGNSYPHLFGEGHEEKTINLGGEYLYKFHFEPNQGIQLVSKEKNPTFIKDIVKKIVDDSLDGITCIVGNNGAGKSTLLKDLMIDYRVIFIEEEFGNHKFFDLRPTPFREAPVLPYVRLYYSTEMNFESFESVGQNAFDISRSSQFLVDNHGDSDQLEYFIRRHKSANIMRWVRFNEFYQFNKIDIINFPFFKELRIELDHFESNNYKQNFHDTPYQFRSLLEKLFKKNEKEPSEIFEELRLSKRKVADKYDSFIKFKYDFYEGLLGRLVEGFESMGNTFLDEGSVPDDLEDYIETNTIDSSIIYFLNKVHVYTGTSRYYFKKTAETAQKLIEFIHKEITEDNISEDNWRAFYLDYKKAKELVALYYDFNESFLSYPFKYYNKPLFKFVEPINLSNGEQSVLNLFSTLYHFKYCLDSGMPFSYDFSIKKVRKSGNKILLMLDEADSGFHPAWKKRYVELIRALVPVIFKDYHVQVIITSHDAITLSDFPRNSIVFLKKQDDKTILLDSNVRKSFAANVSDLLEDSFFIENGLIGDWSNSLITKFINILKLKKLESNNITEEDIKVFFNSIDEPIVKFKLAEMYSNYSKNKNVELQLIDQEIQQLEARRKELE